MQACRHLYFLTLMSECFCRVSLVLSYLGSLSRPITFNQYYIIMFIDQPMQRIKKSIASMQGSLFLACWFRGVLQISSDVQENTIVYTHLHNNDDIAHRYRFKVVLIIDLFVNYRLKRHIIRSVKLSLPLLECSKLSLFMVQ